MAVVVACLLIPGSAAGFNGTVLRGFGTATIDGVPAAGEWDPAGHVDFTVNRSSSEGGGTVPATLFVMNDATNLYVGIRVQNATVGLSTAEVLFDNDHNNSTTAEGEDDIYVDANGNFLDGFVHQTSPGIWQVVEDVDYGGTNDGDERDGNGAGYSFYEFSHPLDSADNAHDFSLTRPTRFGFRLHFRHCPALGSCASTSSYPSGQLAEIVILSGSRVAPETQITAGPRDGSGSTLFNPTFQFTGTDDVLQPSQLVFECKLNEGAWESCRSPKRLDLQQGRHTFSVRSIDDMLNVDASPEQRTWTIDRRGPSRPVIRGRRSLRQGQRLVLRFSAKDDGIGGVHFRCSFDSRVLRRCPARFRVKLRPGRHVVRVRALDRIGNISPLAKFRVTVKPR
jgi:hypothetical protein